jgi:hypothetical protein
MPTEFLNADLRRVVRAAVVLGAFVAAQWPVLVHLLSVVCMRLDAHEVPELEVVFRYDEPARLAWVSALDAPSLLVEMPLCLIAMRADAGPQ